MKKGETIISKPKPVYDLRVITGLDQEQQIVGSKSFLLTHIAGTGLFYVVDAAEANGIKDFECDLILDNVRYKIKTT